MTAALRSAVTLAVLAVLVLVAAVWGWRALTAPLPESAEQPPCVEQEVSAGSPVLREQVAISVYNASSRSGLAGATMESLEERGFIALDTGNAPADTEVGGVQIWADDPSDPAVQLVQQQFNKAKVVPGEALGRGVVVVLGDRFRGLATGVEQVIAEVDATVCEAPADAA